MKEHADKLDDSSKQVIESAIEKVNEATKGEDVTAITSAFSELEQATHALSKHMYESGQQAAAAGGSDQPQPAADGEATGGEDEVIDAEFEKKEWPKDAELHAEEDTQQRELAEAKNNASRLVHDTEKLMKEHADKLDDSSKQVIESSIKKVTEATEGEDVAAITSAFSELEQATHALSKHM
jgi:molecular chaperone DnaK (HSP70)